MSRVARHADDRTYGCQLTMNNAANRWRFRLTRVSRSAGKGPATARPCSLKCSVLGSLAGRGKPLPFLAGPPVVARLAARRDAGRYEVFTPAGRGHYDRDAGVGSQAPEETEMPRIDVHVPTRDGVSNATLHVPEGAGPWPGVLLFTDIFGPRDVFLAIGDRLASLGYLALIPDVYYSEGDSAPFDTKTAFSDEKERNRLFGLMFTLTNERVIADAGDYADFLLARPEVRGTAIGAHGYCMGGRLALVAAGGIGDKIAAAASFHAARSPSPATRTARTWRRTRSARPCSWRAPSRTTGSPRSTPPCSTAR